ncbi:MAG: dTDP-4-dehydrorhamnose 3,5-epimerase family protein [Planctomycetota bacterium]|jgi:dTDP-4-dehydrorhamnose 3,5-epimerase
MTEISKTNLEAVLLIKPFVFEDHRGEYVETYNEQLYKNNGIDVKFVQDDISVSTKNVLRGIHGDDQTWKLISCLYGKFYLVVVNCYEESEDFGKWQSFVLSDSNRMQVLVPPKHGNAHLALSDTTIFHYKQSTYYDRSRQFTYKWNDRRFNIWWPIKNPILSQRDESGN